MKHEVTSKFYTFLKVNLKRDYFDETLKKVHEFYEIGASTINIPAEKSSTNVEFTIFLEDKYFIKVPVYDPNTWNEYFKVTPPKEDYYQVMYTTRQHKLRRECWYWNGSNWCYGFEYPRPVAETCFFDIKFKPWGN